MLRAEFLETVPPGICKEIEDLTYWEINVRYVCRDAIQLHCDSESCQGTRIFRQLDKTMMRVQERDTIVPYICSNCHDGVKTFALRVRLEEDPDKYSWHGHATKIGELPT